MIDDLTKDLIARFESGAASIRLRIDAVDNELAVYLHGQMAELRRRIAARQSEMNRRFANTQQDIFARPAAPLRLVLPDGATRMPDLGEWTNRIEVRSAGSGRLYVIAQHRTRRYFGCSCPGWITHKNCKHLRALGLPSMHQPCEVIMPDAGGSVSPYSTVTAGVIPPEQLEMEPEPKPPGGRRMLMRRDDV